MEEHAFKEGHLYVAAPNGQAAKPVVCAPYSCSCLSFTQVICLAFIQILPRKIFFWGGKKPLFEHAKNFSYSKAAVLDVSPALPLGAAAAWGPPRSTIRKPTCPAAVRQHPSPFWHLASEKPPSVTPRLQGRLSLRSGEHPLTQAPGGI